MDKDLKASIVVRAYNEEQHIEKLLDGIQGQKASFSHETILVDSGSTDRTVKIAGDYGIEIVNIQPEEFSFGYSLNTGIEKARGEFCVFISAHCYPEDDAWLENLMRPFQDPSVALVYGRQRGNHTTRYSEHQIFSKWFPDGVDGIQQNPFCNNANAAIRRSVWEDYRYDEALTGLEDLDWAKHALESGFHIHYAPEARVIHVHEETYPQVYSRCEREAIALSAVYPDLTFTFGEFVKLSLMNTLSDYYHALRDGKLVRNVLSIPAMRLVQFWGTYKGHNYKKPVTSTLKKKFYYPRKTVTFGTRGKKT